MIFESLKKDEEKIDTPFNLKEVAILAIATSIDSLAVGITLSFLYANIALSTILIGSITFVLSIIGVILGHKFGAKYKNKAEFAGGVILIIIGLKILFEHLK